MLTGVKRNDVQNV